MNKERILALADLIERQPFANEFDAPEGFGMVSAEHACGTPSCIAGWAYWEAQGRPQIINTDYQVAAEYLGLAPPETSWIESPADRLFFPGHPDANVHRAGWNATPAQAATVLRHLAETGEVNWSIILEEV